jgi:hypothetical protein
MSTLSTHTLIVIYLTTCLSEHQQIKKKKIISGAKMFFSVVNLLSPDSIQEGEEGDTNSSL